VKRRRQKRHVNHERWLVSYADFITLLFAFFVVLYASAQVDRKKIGQLAVAIQVAFQELGVFSGSASAIPVDSSQPLPLGAVQEIERAKRNPEPPALDATPDAIDDPDLAGLQSELQQALQQQIAEHSIALHREMDGLVISLREFGFFDSGSDQLKTSALPALDRIAHILAQHRFRARIEGHTDNIPIHTAQWASNWELSTARSTGLVRLLIQRYEFNPERLSAAGYAEFHPIATNETSQGRAQNRRVDLVVVSQRILRSVAQPVSYKPSAEVR
jgi:chemotaxis protein MotB